MSAVNCTCLLAVTEQNGVSRTSANNGTYLPLCPAQKVQKRRREQSDAGCHSRAERRRPVDAGVSRVSHYCHTQRKVPLLGLRFVEMTAFGEHTQQRSPLSGAW